MEFADIALHGVGFMIGGGVMWLANELRTNSKEHQELKAGLEEHVEWDKEKLNAIMVKRDKLLEDKK